jgi:hypothetical protein
MHWACARVPSVMLATAAAAKGTSEGTPSRMVVAGRIRVIAPRASDVHDGLIFAISSASVGS